MYQIRFTLNYEIDHKRRVEKHLDIFSKEIGKDLPNVKIERYWKIPDQFQAQFVLASEHTKKEKLIFEVLTLTNKFSLPKRVNWLVNGPHESGNLTFDCILNNESHDHSLKWAHIQLEKA